MKNGNRKFFQGEVMHIYQRAIHGFNIFYTLEDYLVFYTIFSVFVRRFKITALALCLMIDHFHALLVCESKRTLSNFISSVTSLYSRLFNETVGRQGRLFDKSFGSAPKIGDKLVRTAIAYLLNNPVEKNLCFNPEEYRWNFLAYLEHESPFSSKLIRRNVSKKLYGAIREVEQCRTNEKWLNYTQLRRLYSGLKESEYEQLTDFIISAYLPFDKEQLLSYYKSYEMLKLAVKSNTGSEYSIREDYNSYSDSQYSDIAKFIAVRLSSSPKSLLTMSLDEKLEMAKTLASGTSAANRQIAKYLHIPLKKQK